MRGMCLDCSACSTSGRVATHRLALPPSGRQVAALLRQIGSARPVGGGRRHRAAPPRASATPERDQSNKQKPAFDRPHVSTAAAAATAHDALVEEEWKYLEHPPSGSFVAGPSSSDATKPPRLLKWLPSGEEELRVINYGVNLGLLLALGAAAAAKVISVEADQWGSITSLQSLWEVAARVPSANWAAYETAVTTNPFQTKACISGIVYSLGDLTAQTYEGRALDDFDRGRVLRSGLCGLVHGPMSHIYYGQLDSLFNGPLRIDPDSWAKPLAKIAVDQTAWSLLWNSTYYVLLGALKFESPAVILQTVRSSWWDLLKAGWRLWPFAHVITYGVIPVEHRLLWVDAIELVWVTILSLYAQEQREQLAESGAAAGVEGGPVVTQVASALPGAGGGGGDPAEEILRSMRSEREVVLEDGGGGAGARRTVVDIGDVYRTHADARRSEEGDAAAQQRQQE